MAQGKIHWYYGCGWGRPYRGDISPGQFLDDASQNPDWFCVTCATKARLALAAESAPKPDAVIWPKPRPINDAPKNGNRVLVREKFAVGEHWTIARWSLECQDWIDDNKHLCFPTHFLPLPPEVKE